MKRYILILVSVFFIGCERTNIEPIIKKDVLTNFIFINKSEEFIKKMDFHVRLYYPKEDITQFVNKFSNLSVGDSLRIEIKDKLYKGCIYQYMIYFEQEVNNGKTLNYQYLSYPDTLKDIIFNNHIITWPKDSILFQKIK